VLVETPASARAAWTCLQRHRGVIIPSSCPLGHTGDGPQFCSIALATSGTLPTKLHGGSWIGPCVFCCLEGVSPSAGCVRHRRFSPTKHLERWKCRFHAPISFSAFTNPWRSTLWRMMSAPLASNCSAVMRFVASRMFPRKPVLRPRQHTGGFWSRPRVSHPRPGQYTISCTSATSDPLGRTRSGLSSFPSCLDHDVASFAVLEQRVVHRQGRLYFLRHRTCLGCFCSRASLSLAVWSVFQMEAIVAPVSLASPLLFPCPRRPPPHHIKVAVTAMPEAAKKYFSCSGQDSLLSTRFDRVR